MATHTRRWWIRIARATVFTLLAMLLVVVATAVWLLGTTSGVRWLANTALPYAQQHMPDNMRLDVEGIDADTVAHLRIARLTLADAQGVWFSAENILLDWQPRALWYHTVHINEFSAQKLHFVRPPLSEPQPDLPPHEQLAEIRQTLRSLPDSLSMLGYIPPLRIDALALHELVADSGISDVPNRFRFAGLLDFTQQPARMDVKLETLEGVSTTATAHIKGDAESAALDLQWHEEAHGLLGSALLLDTPAPVTLNLTASLQRGMLNTSVSATADSAPLLGGTVNLPVTSKAPISANIQLPTPYKIAPLAAYFPTPLNIGATLGAENLQLAIGSERIAASEQHELHDTTLDAELHFGNIRKLGLSTQLHATLHQPEASPLPLTLLVQLAGDNNAWIITQLDAAAETIGETRMTGAFDVEKGTVKLTGNANVTQGDASFTLQASDVFSTPRAEASVTLQKLALDLPEPLPQVLRLPLTITARTLSAESGANTDGDAATDSGDNNDVVSGDSSGLAAASGEAADISLPKELPSTLPDIALNIASANLNGHATLHPNASGQQKLAQGALNIGGLPLPLALEGHYRAAGNGAVSANSTEWSLSTDYRIQDDSIHLSSLHVKGADSIALSGDIAVNTATTLAQGALNGFVRSTAPLSSLGITAPLVQAAEGTIALQLEHPQKNQQASLSFSSGTLQLDGEPLARNLAIQAKAIIPGGDTPQLAAIIAIEQLKGAQPLDTARLEAEGTPDAIRWKLAAKEATTPLSLDSSGTLDVKDMTLSIASLRGLWQQSELTLAQPLTVQYTPELITLSGLDIRLNGRGKLTGEAILRGDYSEGTFNIAALPLKDLPIGQLQSLEGQIDSSLTVKGTPRNPHVVLNMEVGDLEQNYPSLTTLRSQSLDLRLQAELRDQHISARFHGNAPEAESTVDATLELPVTLSLAPDNLQFFPTGPIQASLHADMLLAPFLPLFLPDGIYGAGHLVADVKVSGTLDAPDIRGEVDLHSGQIEVLQAGTAVKDLKLLVRADGQRITLAEGSASDGADGTLAFSGTLDLTPTLPMNLNASARSFEAVRHTMATAKLSGDANLTGDLTKALLKGAWTIDHARISIQQTPGPSVSEIRVVEVESLEAPLETQEALERSEEERAAAREKRRRERPFDRNLTLDLTVDAPNQIFLEGFGLNAELKGNMSISGIAARPQLAGKMETVRGRWVFFGRTFTITRGEATLSENNLIAPLIDISTETQTQDVTAFARISGTTSKPKIEFSSMPVLPQDEILSRVMFGRNLNTISPYQALQLAEMVRTLSGHGGGGINPLSTLQDKLGIDELKINNDSGNGQDMTVGVGKYLQENVYLEVEGGAGENSGKVSVEVDLTPNISVGTETRQNADSAVRFNYKYDY